MSGISLKEQKMNRGSIGFLLLGVISLMFWTRNIMAEGSPAKLRELKDVELQRIEQALPLKAKVTPAKQRKILVFWLCKGYFHESIPVINKSIEMMGKKTGAFETVTSNDMNDFNASKLAEFDAVVFNNTSKLDFNEPNQRAALMNFVKSGKGIIGIHAAIDNFYTWPEAAEMMGAIFINHPWTAGGTWAIRNAEPNHPLNAAFNGEGFKIKDEIYRSKPLNLRENCRVLLTLDLNDPATRNAKGADANDVNMPIDWIRNYGNGRVFYCGLGHNNEVFYRPAILQHCLDGIQFALGDLKVDATSLNESK
jgi:type 1 glutamine amidotransferase